MIRDDGDDPGRQQPVELTPTPTPARARRTADLSLLPRIFESIAWNQRSAALEHGRNLAAQIASTHPAIAQKLATVLDRVSAQGKPAPILPDGLVEMSSPRHGLDAVTLSETVRRQCLDIIAEHARRDELAAFGLTPRHKALLHGPTGNGKTMLAEALAQELGVPYLMVRYGGLIESFLGSTGKNLDKIFAYARTAPCLLFIDEFDGIAIKRGRGDETGEIRRVTNHLMIEIERLPSSIMLVCATNAEGLLDEAIRRRFDFAIEIQAPTRELRLRRAREELRPGLTPGHDLSRHAEQVADLDLENLHFVTERCREIRRDLVLNAGHGIEALVSTCLGS